MKNLMVLFLMLAALFLSLNASDEDISTDLYNTDLYYTGEYYQGEQKVQNQAVLLPADFDFETANQEFLQAREEGNIERANLLSLQINTYWLENRVESFDPSTHGTGESNVNRNASGSNVSIMYQNNEENSNNNSPLIPYWFDDVRIDPRNGIRETSLVSLSNGDIYCMSKYYNSGAWNLLIRRSVDGGLTWTTFWDHGFPTGISITCPRIVECHDTLIISYIIYQSPHGYRTWTSVSPPGNSYNQIYFGSSSGWVDAEITDLRICTDGSIYSAAYVYATWTEKYGFYDSTKVMFARSNELNISSWEIGPNWILKSVSPSNSAYFKNSRIAHGSGSNLWIVAMFHPNLYLTYYDENIRGGRSINSGSSWIASIEITSSNNGIDEYQPSIAGSHINNNWVLLTTISDTGNTYKRIRNYYSTNNGSPWINVPWVTSYENFLPDIWVDDNSTAFFGACRRDVSSGEIVCYRQGDINDPTSWTNSIRVNDDNSNLSNSYGPSVAYNYSSGDAIIAWTNYAGNNYSIWFDDESWSVSVEEENISDIGNTTEIMNIVNNPSYRNIDLRYTITIPGNVRITLFDVSGRTVSEYVNTFRAAGSYELCLEPDISSGVYYISINSPEVSQTKQVLFIQ